MKTVHYDSSDDIPLKHDCDVIVVGSGPGGLGAAVRRVIWTASRCAGNW